MKRLFIGIKIHPNDELLDFYSKLRMQFKGEKIKWVPAENFHITLKFLGDTSPSLVPRMINSLKEIATKFEKFSIEINGLGSFKKTKTNECYLAGIEKYRSTF
jgi:2'-5' RNA ligase